MFAGRFAFPPAGHVGMAIEMADVIREYADLRCDAGGGAQLGSQIPPPVRG